MGQIRELDLRGDASEAEYEDLDSEYTDTGEEEEKEEKRVLSYKGFNLRRYLPKWMLPGQFSGNLWGQLQTLSKMVGSLAWIFTTSMLLVGLPVLFAYDREKAIQEQQLIGDLAASNTLSSPSITLK